MKMKRHAYTTTERLVRHCEHEEAQAQGSDKEEVSYLCFSLSVLPQPPLNAEARQLIGWTSKNQTLDSYIHEYHYYYIFLIPLG
jgi:hypothetical protein